MKKTLDYLKKKKSYVSAPLGIKETEETASNQARYSPTTVTIVEMVTRSCLSQRRTREKKDSTFTTIKCWFCNKTGHTQIECKTRKNQKKTLTWRKKEVKSKYHNNKIFALIDLEDLNEMKEWTHKIEEEAKLMELPKN